MSPPAAALTGTGTSGGFMNTHKNKTGLVLSLATFDNVRQIASKFSISPGIQGILLNSTRRLKGKQALAPQVIENLR